MGRLGPVEVMERLERRVTPGCEEDPVLRETVGSLVTEELKEQLDPRGIEATLVHRGQMEDQG